MSDLKPKQARLSLNQEAQELIAEMRKAVPDLPESQIATLLFVAALRAMKEEHFALSLPLRFRVERPPVAHD